jgi:hypothetical protein
VLWRANPPDQEKTKWKIRFLGEKLAMHTVSGACLSIYDDFALGPESSPDWRKPQQLVNSDKIRI